MGVFVTFVAIAVIVLVLIPPGFLPTSFLFRSGLTGYQSSGTFLRAANRLLMIFVLKTPFWGTNFCKRAG